MQVQFSDIQTLTFEKKLKVLNLNWIVQRLMQPHPGLGWTREQAEKAIAHYKQFLSRVYFYPECVIVPQGDVDQVWHQHILNTQQYDMDCQWLFGYFLHHVPATFMAKEQQKLACATIPIAACATIPVLPEVRTDNLGLSA
jgi:hypothetical protein